MIFKTCVSLRDRGMEVNKGSIAEELKALGQFGEVGGENYLGGLIKIADAFFLEDHVTKLQRLSALRMLIYVCSKGLRVAVQPKADAITLIRDLLAELGALATRLVDIDPATLRPIAISQIQAIRHKQDDLEEALHDIHNILVDMKYALESLHLHDEEKPKPKRRPRKTQGTKPKLEAQL